MAARPWLQALRTASAIGLLLMTLLVAGVAALWWWSGNEGSLATALHWLQRTQPVVATDVAGSLRAGGRIGNLTWRQQGLEVQAESVELAWQPMALLSGLLKVTRLSAASVRIDDQRAPSAPSGPPASLVLPLPLRLELADFTLGRLQWSGPPVFEASGMAGRYGYDGIAHALELRSLQAAGGSYQGTARVEARGALAMQATLLGVLETQLPQSSATLPLSFQATLSGPLSRMDARASLQARPQAAPRGTALPAATVTARLTPWAAQPLDEARANFRDLDLASFWPQAPHTRLTGQASVRPGTDTASVSVSGGAGAGGSTSTSTSTATATATTMATTTVAWQLSTGLVNTLPGAWDKQRVPVERLTADGEWRGGVALVRTLTARVGGGELRATGRWTGAAAATSASASTPTPATATPKAAAQPAWTVQATLADIDPGALHTAFAGPRIGGSADLRGEGTAIVFETALQATATTKGSAPTDIAALGLREAVAQGRWDRGALSLPVLRLRTRDASLDAMLQLRPAARTGSGRVALAAPGLQLRMDGELAESAGQGELTAQVGDAGSALRWLNRLPGAPAALQSGVVAGSAQLDLRWQGGWTDPTLQARLGVPGLEWRATPAGAPLRVKDAEATLTGRLRQATLALRAQAEESSRRYTLRLAAEGGRTGAAAVPLSESAWQASVTQLEAAVQDAALGPGPWRIALGQPVSLRWTPAAAAGTLEAGAGQATLTAPSRAPATGVARPAADNAANTSGAGSTGAGASTSAALIAWQPVRWQPGRLVSAGRISGLPMAWAELVGGPQLAGGALSGDLVFDGEWDATLAETLRLRATLARRSGDLRVRAETAPGLYADIAAGVREARLSLINDGDRLQLALRWDSERAGTAEGQLATRLAQTGGAWEWPAGAPLEGQLRAQLPRLGIWSVLAPPGWRLRGSLATDLRVSGTRAAPLLAGTLQAEDLALRSVVDGIELGQGRLRVRLDGTRLLIDEFTLHGAGGRGPGGSLTARGEAGWSGGGPQVRLTAQLDRLRASIRTDRQLTVSGDIQGGYGTAGADLQGRLRVDQAVIVLPDEGKPQLGDDVVVRSGAQALTDARPSTSARSSPQALGAQRTAQATAPPGARGAQARPVTLAVALDLGDNFRVQGKGLDTRLRGVLNLAGNSLASPRLTGTLNTEGGQYRAYGQRLDVEQGVLRFTGAVDNPSLDILAVRPNMTQKVGVQITGSALLPRVRLYAQPDMPDSEKLSWLVVGRASASGGAEAALLQQAALALLGGRAGGGMSGGLASSLGLDELSFRGGGSRDGSDTAAQGVVTLGKRFSRNFYVAYERSLGGALGTFFVFYDLSRRVTVRGQTGRQTALDLIFTLQYD